ncbi:N-acetylglucosamine-specific PTS transporter subunit IIBC [Alkalicoccobacillus porphyridii]|uniref:PTS sugar transporter n=1 Tax=Alkalicoccobacillus porphyridii TaxID=2597270 RepID=A0A553ZW03_9BACI|nr:N-acetylglucosamine-specific PTS transporter subunit IIBC [Alkalicoccobacillus porphyridii]TSB45496.1 PTS sugar transporter [Alkalicoccobacillus porphyridii]
MLGFLQRIGRALMLPIAVLPAAGLLFRLGQEDLLNIAFMEAAGAAVFDNLALIFAIGVAIGFSRDGHGAAALSGAIAFFVLDNGTKAINDQLDMSILGGILSGVVAGLLYNRFYQIQLPNWLGFFSGKRLIPIVTALTMFLLAGLFGVVWTFVQEGIDVVSQWIVGAGTLGLGAFGLLNRLLLPLGLHHVLNSMVWFVFGEYEGSTGDLTRFFAGDPTAGGFMAGFFPIMMFGLPAACLAMILAAKPERRASIAGILGGLALTSFITGITEPLEFTFMFLAPVLFVVHAILTASSMMIVSELGILHGFTFSAGAIDYVLNMGIATRPQLLLVVGAGYSLIYFLLFYFLIIKFDIKTPGREDEPAPESVHTTSSGSKKYEEMAPLYLAALGGKENIQSLNNCVTRLRLEIHDVTKVDEEKLKTLGAKGVQKISTKDLQVIIGTDVEFLADAMRSEMK